MNEPVATTLQEPDLLMMDDLRFYVPFNSISVISGRWRMIMKGCVQWNPVYG